MGTITLPNFRTSADVKMNTALKDGGVSIDWSALTDIKAWLWSDAQRAIAGRCDVRVDAEDTTKLICEYASTKPQYLGVNRLIVQANYMGATKTYDKPVFNFVRWTADQAGQQITIDDPEIDVEIEVEDVTSSILQAAIAIALQAAADAEHAAHLIPNQILLDCEQATAEANAAGIDEVEASVDNQVGTPSVDVDLTNKKLTLGFHNMKGETPNISIGSITTGEPGTPAIATITGTPENPVLNLRIPKGQQGLPGNTGSSVSYPFELVANNYTNDPEKALAASVGYSLTRALLKAQLPMYQNKSVALGSTIGATINLTPKSESGWNCAVVECSPGDVFFVTGTGGVSGRLWGFVDKDNKLISVSESYRAIENIILVAPANATHFVVNTSTSDASYCLRKTSVVKRIETIEGEVNGNASERVSGAYLNADGQLVASSDSITSEYIPCPVGAKIYWYHGFSPYKGAASLCMYNSDKELLSHYTCNTDNARTLEPPSESLAYIRASFSSSAEYVYVNINGVIVWEWRNNVKVLNEDIKKINTVHYDTRTMPYSGGKLSDAGVWLNTSKYSHIAIPCGKGDKVTVIGGNSSKYALLQAYPSPYTGDNAILVPGTSLTPLQPGIKTTITIPDGCAYIYFESGDTTTTVRSRESMPDFLEIEHPLVDNIETLNEKRMGLGVTVSFIGAGDSYRSCFTDRVYGVVPGNPYRIYFTKKPTVHSGTRNYPRTRVYSYNESNQSTTLAEIAQSQNLPNFLDIVAPNDCSYLRVAGRCALGEVQEMVILPMSESSSSSGDILSLNPDTEFIPKMQAAAKRYYTSTQSNLPTPLVLAQISDIHGNWTNVERFLKFVNHHSDKIDLVVNTGDTVNHQYSDGIDGYAAKTGVDDIINVVGNHDTLEDSGGTTSWTGHVGTDAYDMLIAPFVSNWEVTQPDDAAENGKCYFYKDFADKHIRLIFADMMGYDDDQNTWLQSLLADAITSEYHVAIVAHFCPSRTYNDRAQSLFSLVECNYSTLYETGTSSSNLSQYNTVNYKMGEAVAAFINGGGHFVGYISGHYHKDFVAKHDVHPDQMIYAVGSSKAGEVSDYSHTVGTRSQDEFQIVSIDTKNTIVKLFKVGANYDRFGRSKSSVCVDYSQCKVIGEGF